jgi:hypothetical protein
VEVPNNNDHRDDQTAKDHTEDILEWAKRKICAVSESKPFRMAPLDHSMIEPEPEPPTPEPELNTAEPKAVEPKTVEAKTVEAKTVEPKVAEPKTVELKAVEPKTVEPKAVEPPKVSTFNMATRLVVLELDEANANQGKFHLLADDQEAGRFIEGLLENGLAPERLAALRGTRMSVNVRYRVEASIEHLAHE